MGKEYVEIVRFDGGANRKYDPLQVPLDQALVLRSIGFDTYGSLRTFNGYSTYNSGEIASKPIDGLFSFKPSTMSALLVSVCDGSVFVNTGVSTTPVSVPSGNGVFNGFTTKLIPCDMAQFQDLLFLSDGFFGPFKFNGTEFTRAGVSAPTQALSAFSNAGGGNLTGDYVYVYAGVNSYSAEGDYGGASPSITVTTAQVRVTNIPTAPVSHGIISWNVYRNTANAQGVYWKVTAVSNGVTSFTDNVADSSLTVAASTDQGYLRKFKYLLAAAGRLWGTVGSDSLLWFSELDEPETFPSTNFLRVGEGDGLQISSLAVHSGLLVISKSNWSGKTAIYTLNVGDSVAASDPENWYLRKVSDFGGSDSHWGVAAYSNYLFMPNSKGAYAFNGTQIALAAAGTDDGVLVTHRLDELYGLPEDEPGGSFTLDPAEFISMASINWKDKLWISLDQNGLNQSTEFGKNSITHIFDYQRKGESDQKEGAWSRYHGSLGISRFAIHENMLLGASSAANGTSANGTIYQLDNEDNFLTNEHRYMMPPLKGKKGHENKEKDFRYVFLTAVADSGTPSLTVQTGVNIAGRTFSPVLQSHTVTLSTTSTRYRLDLTGVHHGKWFSLVLFSSSSAHWSISKIEVHYNLRGSRNA